MVCIWCTKPDYCLVRISWHSKTWLSKLTNFGSTSSVSTRTKERVTCYNVCFIRIQSEYHCIHWGRRRVNTILWETNHSSKNYDTTVLNRQLNISLIVFPVLELTWKNYCHSRLQISWLLSPVPVAANHICSHKRKRLYSWDWFHNFQLRWSNS